MAINIQKVIVGGVAAGVVVGAIDFVANGIVFAEQNEAALNALNLDLAGEPWRVAPSSRSLSY